jgi:hypothetical protein
MEDALQAPAVDTSTAHIPPEFNLVPAFEKRDGKPGY